MGLVQFYPLDFNAKIVNQRPVVVIYGRTTAGKQISVVDGSYFPYFYIIPKDTTERLETELKKFTIKVRDDYFSILGIEKKTMKLFEKDVTVLIAYYNNPFGVSYLVDELKKKEDVKEIYEHDVPFITSYLLDKKIVPGILTDVDGEIVNMHSRVPIIRANSIEQNEQESIKPRILAFDIETYSPSGKSPSTDHDPIIMISFSGERFRKTVTWKQFKTENKDIEFVAGEFELLSRFKRLIEEYKPDLLVGYSSDLFAFPYMKKRAEKYGIKFDLGLDHSIADISKTETSIKGIVHLDLYKLIYKVLGSKLETDTFRLKDVAQELLGESKKVVDIERLAYVWDHDPAQLEPYCDYTQQDAILINKLAQKLFPLLQETVKATNMQFFDVARASYPQFVEAFLMRESRFANEMIPHRPSPREYMERKKNSLSAPITVEPEAGLYQNILVYDFQSLYPAIVAVHNISHGTLSCRCCTEIVPNEETHFCKIISGFIPKLASSLIDRRQRIISMMKDNLQKTEAEISVLSARQESLKLLANALASQFGQASSRWYDLYCAKAVRAYATYHINAILEKTKQEGLELLYADADAVFLKLKGKQQEEAERFFESLNMALPEKMNLGYDGFYPKGLFIASKTGRKKYALLSRHGFLKMKGFESVRKHMSTIAKQTQEKVLYLILKEGKIRQAFDIAKTAMNEIRSKIVPLRKMIIYTHLQKDLLKYETIGPHVAVAKKMQESGFNVSPGSIIRYVVGEGDGSISERSQMPGSVGEYDAEYYAEHQLIPAVEKIFEAVGVDFRKALEEKEQASLGEFI